MLTHVNSQFYVSIGKYRAVKNEGSQDLLKTKKQIARNESTKSSPLLKLRYLKMEKRGNSYHIGTPNKT